VALDTNVDLLMFNEGIASIFEAILLNPINLNTQFVDIP